MISGAIEGLELTVPRQFDEISNKHFWESATIKKWMFLGQMVVSDKFLIAAALQQPTRGRGEINNKQQQTRGAGLGEINNKQGERGDIINNKQGGDQLAGSMRAPERPQR